eukprot:PhF_6_TR37914/c0_g1_i2/m.56650
MNASSIRSPTSPENPSVIIQPDRVMYNLRLRIIYLEDMLYNNKTDPDLVAELCSTKLKLDEIMHSLKDAQNRIEHLESQKKDLEENVRHSQRTIHDVRLQHNEDAELLRNVRVQSMDSQAEISRLTLELSHTTHTLKEMKEECVNLQNTISQMHVSLREKEAAYVEREHQHALEISAKDRELRLFEEDIIALRSQLANESARAQQTQREFVKELEATRAREQESVMSEAQRYQRSLEALENEKKTLLAAERKHYDRMLREVEDLSALNIRKERDELTRHAEQRINECQEKHIRDVISLRNALSAMEVQAVLMEEDRHRRAFELDESEARSALWARSVSDVFRLEHLRYRMLLSHAEERSRVLQRHATETEETLRSRIEDMAAHANALQERNLSAQSSIQALQTQRNSLEENVMSSRRMIGELEKACDAAEANCGELRGEVRDLTVENERLRTTHELCQGQLQQASGHLEAYRKVFSAVSRAVGGTVPLHEALQKIVMEITEPSSDLSISQFPQGIVSTVTQMHSACVGIAHAQTAENRAVWSGTEQLILSVGEEFTQSLNLMLKHLTRKADSVSGLMSKVEGVRRNVFSLKSYLANSKRDVAELKKDLAALNCTHSDTLNTLTEVRIKQEQNERILLEKITLLESAIVQERAQRAEILKQTNEMRTDRDVFMAQLDDSKARYNELRQRYEVVLGEMESVRRVSRSLREEVVAALRDVQGTWLREGSSTITRCVGEHRQQLLAHLHGFEVIVSGIRNAILSTNGPMEDIQSLLLRSTQEVQQVHDIVERLYQSRLPQPTATSRGGVSSKPQEPPHALAKVQESRGATIEQLVNRNERLVLLVTNLVQQQQHLETDLRGKVEAMQVCANSATADMELAVRAQWKVVIASIDRVEKILGGSGK